jgi:cytochrome c
MRKLIFLLVLVLAVSLAACGGSSGSSSGGANAAAGEELFNEKLIGVQPGCVTCHSLEAGVTMVGPSLAGIATTAGTRESGKSAEEYLTESITEPDTYVVDGFDAGTMPAGLADEMDDQQVADLVAYLMTLK